MGKNQEKEYFKKIGQAGIDFTLQKPFSDTNTTGSLLSDIAAIFTLLPKPPATLLDLGCGSGWTSNFFAQSGYDVLGVDISSEAIIAAKKHFILKNLSFLHADYDKLGHHDKFDVAVFFDSLHHSDDETEALKEVYKTLKPNGQVVLCEPGSGHSKSATSLDAIKNYGVSERDMPPKISKKALKKAGFINIKTFIYPALSHRMSYKSYTGIKGKVCNIPGFRGLSLLALCTILKRNHGIVLATKPNPNS